MREQISHLLQRKTGTLPYEKLFIRYRHEQPWGVPCTLDVYAEKEWTDASKKKHTLELLPPNYETIAANLPRIVEKLVKPVGGFIMAVGAQGVSLLWRETPEESAVSRAAAFDHYTQEVQAHLPGLDVSLAEEELRRLYHEQKTALQAAEVLHDWLVALAAAGGDQ